MAAGVWIRVRGSFEGHLFGWWSGLGGSKEGGADASCSLSSRFLQPSTRARVIEKKLITIAAIDIMDS